MNILTKSGLLFLLLFLSGCAHHSGHYSGRSNHLAFGISIDNLLPPLPPLPIRPHTSFYSHDAYIHKPVVKHKYRGYKPHKQYHSKKHGYDHHNSGHQYERHARNDMHQRKGKNRKGRGNHWDRPSTRKKHYR